jgi:AcrR family transcriptional regulator
MTPASDKPATRTTRSSASTATHVEGGTTTPQRRLAGPERRTKIIEASRHVFLKSGLSGTRTRDLAQEAGIAEAMIYRHFDSKEDLFEAAILQPLEDLIAQMLTHSEVMSLLDGRTRLTVATQIHQQICEAMVDILPLLGVALFSDVDSGRKFWTQRVIPLVNDATRSMTKMREGWEHSEIDPRLQFLALLGMYIAVALDAHFGETPVDCPAVARQLARLTAKGVQR